MIKIIQQAALICVACFLLWVAFQHSFTLVTDLEDVDIGKHGNIALILAVVLGSIMGIGLAGVFFYFARIQSKGE